jgi:hypothetical protein
MTLDKPISHCKTIIKYVGLSKVWRYTPVILALRRLRQEDDKLSASLGYLRRPCLNKTN